MMAGTDMLTMVAFKKMQFDKLTFRIDNVKCISGPSFIQVDCETNFQAVAIVELFRSVTGDSDKDMKQENLVSVHFPFLGGLTLIHSSRFEGLQQDSQFWWRITAPSPTKTLVIKKGSCQTGKRTATVRFEKLKVELDGDPGADGEMIFEGRIYDAETRSSLTGEFQYPAHSLADLGDGDEVHRPFGETPFVLDPAPDAITMLVRGTDDDHFLFLGGDFRISIPMTAPSAPAQQDVSSYQFSDALHTYKLPNNVGTSIIGFHLPSVHGPTRFHLVGEINCTVTPPSKKKSLVIKMAMTHARALTSAPIAATMHSDGALLLYALGPNGRVHEHSTRRRRTGGWRPIDAQSGNTLIVIGARSPEVHVLLRNDEGAWQHTLHGRGITKTPLRWTTIGERLGPELIPSRAADGGLAVFTLSDRGDVLHRTLDHQGMPSSDWRSLGGEAFRTLCIAGNADTGFNLFGATAEGVVFQSPWRGDQRPLWTEIATRAMGKLGAESDQAGNIALICIDDDGVVRARICESGQWPPDTSAWEVVDPESLEDRLANEEHESELAVST